MRVTLTETAPAEIHADVLAVSIAAGEGIEGAAFDVDSALGGQLRDVIDAGEHRGRLHEVLPVQTAGRIAACRVLLYGLGARKDLDGQRLRYAHHELVRAARTYGYSRLAVVRTAALGDATVGPIVEGCVMGAWERRQRQTAPRPDRADLDELLLSGFGQGHEREVVAAQEAGEATNRARDWQNLPPNQFTPEIMAQEAHRVADRHGCEIEVLGPAELRAGGYNLILGVAYGSAQPPQLIRLLHKPVGDSDSILALVGKGITFDSGGLSLKTADGMLRMKGDMAGAAAVLAAFDVIAGRGLPLNVMAVLAASENMPGPSAQRPGDIVVSASGKTVEIVNTDSEGRLVLADAITLALRHGATHIVDLATLTGAATIAIGHAATAGISNDDQLWGQVAEAAERAGDRVWRLPIYPDYRVLLASPVADLKNSNYGEAGAITGGMFIEQFVEDRPWVHLDIAASSWNSNDQLTSVPRGPTGAGTRLCIELAERMSRPGR